ncbi:hypothetical protein [Streptomyces eurythermus]|uniref:hypothetical protein n=1 Tax=Streptomyces eurythermus TaxID=42237 RepID=UPI0036D3F12E
MPLSAVPGFATGQAEVGWALLGVAEPGLLTGLSGHGLGLLRLGLSDLVPPALPPRTPDPHPIHPGSEPRPRTTPDDL